MLVSRSVQRDIYYVMFFQVSRSTQYMIFEKSITHELSYYWQYDIKAGCRFVKWYWFQYTVRVKWENISLDFVSWDIFSFITHCIPKSVSHDSLHLAIVCTDLFTERVEYVPLWNTSAHICVHTLQSVLHHHRIYRSVLRRGQWEYGYWRLHIHNKW